MNMRRVGAMARKEFLHVLRDRRSLMLAVAIPALMMSLFGWALTLDVNNVPMVVYDQSQTQASRDFIATFTGSRYFAFKQGVQNYHQLEEAIDKSEALVGLVIPPEFGRHIDTGRPVTVQLIIDGSDANTATIALGYAQVVVLTFSQDLAFEQLRRVGGVTQQMPLDIRPRVWFNIDLESRNYIIPGLIAVIMMIVAALLTSLTVAREWERGTMEQLVSTPVQAGELILGKLVPYFTIAMVDVILAIVMSQVVFHVPLRGSVALLLIVSSIFLAGVLCMGLLISIGARNQLVASQLGIILTFVPSYLLSGFIFAIPNMPAFIQTVTYVVPARYFIAVLKGIYLKGVGLEVLGGEVVLLVVFGLLTATAAKLKFKKRLG
jgi:ABC-2 type transport system permease protein